MNTILRPTADLPLRTPSPPPSYGLQVHIDPGPNQEMMVEGEALTSLLTLRAPDSRRWWRGPSNAAGVGGDDAATADRSASRTLVPLRLSGRGSEEVYDHAAISRNLEAPCERHIGGGQPSTLVGGSGSDDAVGSRRPAASGCWRAHMVAGTLDAAAFHALRAEVRMPPTGHQLDVTRDE